MAETGRIGTAAIALLALATGGCWASEAPLILAHQSAQPIPAGTYDYHVGGEIEKAEVAGFPGGGYVYRVEREALPLLALPVAPDWYVIQIGTAEDPSLYGLAHIDGTRLEFHDPPCEDWLGNRAGMSRMAGDCDFATAEALVSAAGAVVRSGTLGEPESWLDLASLVED